MRPDRPSPWRTRPIAALAILLAAGLAACSRGSSERATKWTDGDPDRGAIAIRRVGCSSCHTIPGVPGADGLVGPPLTHIASRTYIAGKLTNTPEHMKTFIAKPHGADPRIAMPDMGLADPDLSDITAYLYTLR